MKKFLKKKLGNEKGMTLIELLAVIVILAIIAAIAIPAIGGIIDNSRVGAVKSDAQNVISAGELYFIDAPTEPSVTLQKLSDLGFVDDVGSFETAAGAISTVTVFNKVAATTGASATAAKPVSITGTGINGKITVEFATATRDHIGKYGNSQRGADTVGTSVITATKN